MSEVAGPSTVIPSPQPSFRRKPESILPGKTVLRPCHIPVSIAIPSYPVIPALSTVIPAQAGI